MIGYAIIKDGWVSDIVIGGINRSDYSDAQIVEMSDSEATEAMSIQPILYWDGQFYQARDDKKIWQRLRSLELYGYALSGAFRGLKGIDIYPDIPSTVEIGEPIPISKVHEFVPIEIKPELSLELSTESDVDLWVAPMVESGLYTEEDAWLDTVSWLSDPLSWGIKTVWKDKVIQLEMYHFQKTTVYTGFQTHLERRLPLWFWQQVAKPLIKRFMDIGMKDGYGYVRSDRRDWAEGVWKGTYNNEEIKSGSKFIHLHNTLEGNLAGIGEWPERKTVPDWRFEKDGYVVQEATLDQSIIQAAGKSWGDSPRKELALRAIEEDWELCNATFIVTTYNGEIVSCVSVREKDKETSSLSYPFKPHYGPPQAPISFEGLLWWHKEVGYKEISVTIEEKLFDRVKPFWERYGFKPHKQWFGLVAYKLNVDEVLSAYK